MMNWKVFLFAAVIILGCDRPPSPEETKAQQDLLNQASQQVEKIADDIATRKDVNATSVELDPWAQRINVEYQQEWATSNFTVRSNGPDKVAHTSDDIVKRNSITNAGGLISGIPAWAWIAAVWVVSIFLVLIFRGKRRRRYRRTHAGNRAPLALSDFLLVLAAPLAVLGHGVISLIEAFGAEIDFDPFDIDLDFGDIGGIGDGIDLDIDL